MFQLINFSLFPYFIVGKNQDKEHQFSKLEKLCFINTIKHCCQQGKRRQKISETKPSFGQGMRLYSIQYGRLATFSMTDSIRPT